MKIYFYNKKIGVTRCDNNTPKNIDRAAKSGFYPVKIVTGPHGQATKPAIDLEKYPDLDGRYLKYHHSRNTVSIETAARYGN